MLFFLGGYQLRHTKTALPILKFDQPKIKLRSVFKSRFYRFNFMIATRVFNHSSTDNDGVIKQNLFNVIVYAAA